MKNQKNLTEICKKVCLLLPTYKQICTPAYQSMISFISSLYKNGHEVAVVMVDKCNVVSARNQLATEAYHLEQTDGADVYAWIDSDHTFTYEDFATLAYHRHASGAQILSAKNFSRNADPKACAYVKKDGGYIPIPPDLDTPVQEVDAVGFGFLLVTGDVIRTMYEKHGPRQFMIRFADWDTTDLVSEDIAWCELAAEAGYKICVDNLVVPGHYGAIIDNRFVEKFINSIKES